ncbi:hypothetical protein ACHAXN_007532 [Cyclotella atomus]
MCLQLWRKAELVFGGACADDDLAEVRARILSGCVSFDGDVWTNVSDMAKDFIKLILQVDPHKRPSVDELPKHPWIVTMKRNSSVSDDEMPLDPKVVSGLVKFKEMSSTTKFLCEVLSFTLQPEQLGLLRIEFEKLDTGKGEISLDGLKMALMETDLTDDEVEQIFNGLHVRNKDFTIRWHEFIAACLGQCKIDERNWMTRKQLWITMEVTENKKEHMTYDVFYKLLKIDRHYGMDQDLSKSMPICDNLADSVPDVHVVPRRHSLLDSKMLDSPVVSKVKTYRRLQSVILDASKFVGDGKATRPMKRPVLSFVDLRKTATFRCFASYSTT